MSFGKKKNELGLAPRPKSVHYGAVISPGGDASPHGSTYIRVLERLKIDYQPGIEWDHLSFEEVIGVLGDLDFLLIQRNALTSSQASEIVQLSRQLRTRLIFEIDDDLTIGNRIPDDLVNAIKILLSGSDVVLTSTAYLRTRLKKYNVDVRVIPNKLCGETWLDDGYLTPPSVVVHGDGVKILYMGTYSHAADLDLVRPALDMLRENGIQATVYAIGIGKDIESDTVKTIDVPAGWATYPKFVRWLRSTANNFDFAIAPLANNEFNRCKSGLKYLDYGAIKLAGLFSDSVSYNDIVTHGDTGLLVKNTTRSWYNSLVRMCEDVGLRNKLSAAAFFDVTTHHMIDRRDSVIYAEALGINIACYRHSKVSTELIEDSEEFDPHWYVHSYHPPTYPFSGNIINSNEAAKDYLRFGADKSFDPSPLFSTQGYLERYKDVKSAGVNPLVHYLRYGKKEGRSPRPKIRSINPLIRPDALGPVGEILPFGANYAPSSKSVAVHLHAYHRELVDETINYLKNIEQKFSLFVSVKDGDMDAVKDKLLSSLPYASVIIRTVENRGRDVAPWVVSFRDEIRRHDFFCHIHTKSTVHTEGHRNWRLHLLHETLASPATISKILTLLEDPDTGLVMPPYFQHVSNQPQWGANKERSVSLLRAMGNADEIEFCEDYPAGSFFWAKTEILEPLFDLNLKINDFDKEAGQNDGTLAHAIERIMGFLPTMKGYDTICTAVEKSAE